MLFYNFYFVSIYRIKLRYMKVVNFCGCFATVKSLSSTIRDCSCKKTAEVWKSDFNHLQKEGLGKIKCLHEHRKRFSLCLCDIKSLLLQHALWTLQLVQNMVVACVVTTPGLISIQLQCLCLHSLFSGNSRVLKETSPCLQVCS